MDDEKKDLSGARRTSYALIPPDKKKEMLEGRRVSYAAKKPGEKNNLLKARRQSYSASDRCERGRELRRTRDLRGAESEFREALIIDPRCINAHIYLAVVLNEKGDKRGAEDEYRATLTMFPRNFLAHYNLGNLLESSAEKVAMLRAAVNINPSNSECLLCVDRLLAIPLVLSQVIPSCHLGCGISPRRALCIQAIILHYSRCIFTNFKQI